jgi:RepB DNA-primase from phage plasmid
MTAANRESNHGVTSVAYVRWLFEPSDRLAVLVRNRERGKTMQRIATAGKIIDDSFQQWLRFKNEEHSADIYVGMNPLKPEARARTKEDIHSIRHLYLDLDHDAQRSLAEVEQSSLVPQPNVVIATSSNKFQVVWRVAGFSLEQAETTLRAMARKFGGDPAATDSTRVLRLPGFVNRKYDAEFTVSAEIRNEQRYTPHDFRLRTDPAELDQLPTRTAGSRQASSTRQPLSQSEHDWAYAKRSLAKGVPAEEVIRQIATFREHDKHNPEDYARRTVEKAQAQLLEAKHLSDNGSQMGLPHERE